MQFDRLIKGKIRLRQPPPDNGYRGELEVSNLRMAFSISKSISWATNTASFRIYNLGSDKRNQLAYYGDEVRIFAGYAQNSGVQLLFIGNTTQTNHTFAGTEILTVLDVGDGEKILNEILISISFAENTPVRTIISNIAERMGLEVVYFADTENLVYSQGYRDCDLAKNILTTVCNKLNLVWTVQNNNLLIMKNGQGSERKPPVDINSTTGMIGVPERYSDKRQYDFRALPPDGAPKPGWRVKTLLRPDLLPGDHVRIKSVQANIDAVFYILTITHEGDNFGPVFESTLEVISL